MKKDYPNNNSNNCNLAIAFTFYVIVYLLLAPLATAQVKDNKDDNVINAINIYENMLQSGVNDPNLILKVAQEYYFIEKFQEAKKWYTNYYQHPDGTPKPIDDYRYGQVLKQNNEFKKADVYLRSYYESKGMRYTPLISNSNTLLNTINNEGIYQLLPFKGNTELSEYPAFLQDEQLYVAGSNLERSKRKRSNTKDDLYLYNGGSYTRLNAQINSSVNEGSMTISADGQFMFFSRNDYYKDRTKHNRDKEVTINIYMTELVDGDWKGLKAFPFNSDDYSIAHPSLSRNNRVLYFVSNMPGGKGGSDLYMVEYYGDGEFGEPKNLEDLNTEFDEMFPFIDKRNGDLYFSSNREESIGGLDIFISRPDSEGSYTRAYNIGAPINSTYDDFAFTINKNNGYFSSNRENTKGMDDIFKFMSKREYNVPNYIKVNGNVLDKDSNTNVAGTKVYLYDKEGNIIERTTTDASGNFKFSEHKDSQLGHIKIVKPGYQDIERNLSAEELKNNKSLQLKTTNYGKIIPEKIGVNGTLLDQTTGQPIPNAKIRVLDIDNRVIAEAETDSNGDYTLGKISSKNSQFIRIEKDDYLIEEVALDLRKVDNGKLDTSLNLVKRNVSVELGNNVGDILNPIYFDYGKSDITEASKIELEKVVAVLNKFPSISMQIEAHTDSQGSDKTNYRLSSSRAKSTYDYLIYRNIDASRISYKGYGERQILNKCKNGVKCSEAEHQINRRSVFKIVKVQ